MKGYTKFEVLMVVWTHILIFLITTTLRIEIHVQAAG